jgi:tRNA-2-methylthio-N6-dimethylallyladenosine synthase
VNSFRGAIDDDHADLAELIHYVAAVQGVERVRYTTSHPLDFSPTLIDAYAQIPELVDHLHLPVQSGSDRILAAMKRGHGVQEYKDKIAQLRAIRPNISLSSDFIVGFPGETDEDFAETMALIEEIKFDVSFSFIYSARPGTPAAALPDDTPEAVKKSRLQQLQTTLREQAEAIADAMVGTRQVLLVTGLAKKKHAQNSAGHGNTQLAGRTENNRVVNFAGSEDLIGHFATVDVTEALPNSLRATLV